MSQRILSLTISLVLATLATTAAADDSYAARLINPLSVIERRQSGCPGNAYPCPDGNGCCPNGTQCTAGGHCGVSCAPSDPRCGDGCCPLSWNATCDPRTFQCIVGEGPPNPPPPPPSTPPPPPSQPPAPPPPQTSAEPTTADPVDPPADPPFTPPTIGGFTTTSKVATPTRSAGVAGITTSASTGLPLRSGADVTHVKAPHAIVALIAGLTWIIAF